MRLVFAVSALVLALISAGRCEIFTSVEEFRGVFKAHRGIAKELRNYLQIEEKRIEKIEMLIKKLEDEFELPPDQLNDVIMNPLKVHDLIKKHQRESYNFEKFLLNTPVEKLAHQTLKSWLQKLPSEEDAIGSALGLFRLQDTYNLSPSAFVDGRLPGLSKNYTRLTVNECFDIGKIAYLQGKYAECIPWMDEALKRLESEPTTENTVNRATILDFLAFANFKVGEVETALKQSEELLELEPQHAHAKKNIEYYLWVLDPSNKATVEKPMKPILDENVVNYLALCRGESTKKVRHAHKLSCDYATNNDPRLLIAPLKRETLSLEPWIFVYYDAITDDEIDFLKKSALSQLYRATTFGNDKDAGVDYRITKLAWVPTEADSFEEVQLRLSKLHKRISVMTQLNHANVESFQVANYGIGGHYTPHFDYTRHDEVYKFDSRSGNRIASLIFYLSDIKAGGGTVFPKLGVGYQPVKRSALMWFNLDKAGQVDERTMHGACPVLVGIKWIATKWFHERTNELWHQCDLKPNTPFCRADFERAPVTPQRIIGRMNTPNLHSREYFA